jgi:hypothetical protein
MIQKLKLKKLITKYQQVTAKENSFSLQFTEVSPRENQWIAEIQTGRRGQSVSVCVTGTAQHAVCLEWLPDSSTLCFCY